MRKSCPRFNNNNPSGAATNTKPKYTLNQLLQQSISSAVQASSASQQFLAIHRTTDVKDVGLPETALRTSSSQFVLVPSMSTIPAQHGALHSRRVHVTTQPPISNVRSSSDGNRPTLTDKSLEFRGDLSQKSTVVTENYVLLTDWPSKVSVMSASPLQQNEKLHNISPHYTSETARLLVPEESSGRMPDIVHPICENFDWDAYLKIANTKLVPHIAFKHVEISLRNGFSPGMKFEVANKSNISTYWVATLVSTSGSLILLRYDGCDDDRKNDFWVDACSADIHPIGWCSKNNKVLQPPKSIRNAREDWAEFLVENLIGARTAPECLLNGPFTGKTVIDIIRPGMLLEVHDSKHPQHVWMACVLKNIGGRLLLRYKGLTDLDNRHDFWLFYLDIKLHNVGWGKARNLTMNPPDSIRNKYSSKEQWAHVLSASLQGVTEDHLVPAYVFRDQNKLETHEMKVGYKLAVLDPTDPMKIRPATVIRVVNEHFFLSEIDNLSRVTASQAFLCHRGSVGLFSVEWCKKYKISVCPPSGYDCSNFNWDVYLQFVQGQAAPDSCFFYANEAHSFEAGMMLEACSPYNLYEIGVANILNVHGNILHVRLIARSRNTGHNEKEFVDCYVVSSSQDIFPLGWCHSNGYPLTTPQSWEDINSLGLSDKVLQARSVQDTQTLEPYIPSLYHDHSICDVINPNATSKLWCPVVFFNVGCKSGVFMNDDDFSRLPRSIGPGNTVLVLREVLTLLVRAAEKPHKLLKDLEDFTNEQWYHPCIIKTKFNGKKYQGTVQVVSIGSEVPGFLKSLSQFLRCCPFLVSLNNPVKMCPLNCMKTRGIRYNILSGKERGRKVLANNKVKRRDDLLDMKPQLTDCSVQSTVGSIYSVMNIDVSKRLQQHQSRKTLGKLHLLSNPINWSVDEVVEFIQSTDCSRWSSFFANHKVDGQAFMLLTLPVLQECLNTKLGVALKIARHVERVKAAFYETFCHG